MKKVRFKEVEDLAQSYKAGKQCCLPIRHYQELLSVYLGNEASQILSIVCFSNETKFFSFSLFFVLKDSAVVKTQLAQNGKLSIWVSVPLSYLCEHLKDLMIKAIAKRTGVTVLF